MEQKCPQCGAPLPSGVLAGLCPACLFKQGAAADTAAAPPEAPPFQPPSVEELGRLFPQFEILGLIGKGGMGAVYRARQPALDRIVALKILPPQTAGGPGFVERFNREARALAKLNHPNIVAVYEFGQVDHLLYFIMEFVDGLNLRELERAGRLTPAEALQIVPQICEALQFAHDEGIVHRDIKPENILLDKKGRVKIADFGIAKILGRTAETDLTQTRGTIGTPHYMAPEQMEKPTTVDHRADIFSLGVVFYEMLTGELPLGKFAPPSSRKVEVDVRLDEVVLRALEKDPDRRYQHVSQVKTAVDTIASNTAPPPCMNGPAIAREILNQDYHLSIRSCLRRGWKLLTGEFWPFVGITALIFALLGFATAMSGASVQHGPAGHNTTEISSTVAMIVWGPLMGGLMFYFLKKIRRQPATVELAFCGFSQRFLPLFLAGFVTTLLTGLGFFCFILPGVYLLIAWMFTLPLVLDKQLDFWSAMELSRKVVTRHWFKFLGLGLILMLLELAGVLALFIGVLVAAPWIIASLMYAYEDVFGAATGAEPGPKTGPHGTVVSAPATPPVQPPSSGSWLTPTKIGLAFVLVVLAVLAASIMRHVILEHKQRVWNETHQMDTPAMPAELTANDLPASPAGPVEPATPGSIYGPAAEATLTNNTAINLSSGKMEPLADSITGQARGPGKDTAACAWLESQGMDFAFVSSYDGFYGMPRDLATLKRDDWDQTDPEVATEALHDTGQDVAVKFGDDNRLASPTNYTYAFKTRDGRVGLLQFISYSENPPGAKIRYKLASLPAAPVSDPTIIPEADARLKEELSERLDAASSVLNLAQRDALLAAITADAAKEGEPEAAKKALDQMNNREQRDQAARDAALQLARGKMRRQAIELAKSIINQATRDETLSELAQPQLPDAPANP